MATTFDGGTMNIEGDKLIIEVDISTKAVKAAQPSGSGKTRMVASTRGFMRVNGHDKIKVSLNVTTPKDGK